MEKMAQIEQIRLIFSFSGIEFLIEKYFIIIHTLIKAVLRFGKLSSALKSSHFVGQLN